MEFLDEGVFEAIFQPITNEDGTDTWEEIPEGTPEEYCWSVFDDEDDFGMVVQAGLDIGDPVYYVITAVAWESRDTVAWWVYLGPSCDECHRRYVIDGTGLCERCTYESEEDENICATCCEDPEHHKGSITFKME